jgi:large repetitive protein
LGDVTPGKSDDDEPKERRPVAAGGRTKLGRSTFSKLRILVATLAVALVTVTPALSAPDTPNLVGPDDAQTVSFLPVFSWDPVAGADKYNFVLSADDSFNSPVYTINGTKNTRATPYNTVPNGTYYWRVQAVDADGNVSNWSDARSIEKLWADSPTLTAPDDAATISFPDEPLVLKWDPVPGAAKYHVYISADPDPSTSTLVTGSDPLETQATNAAPRLLLPSNTYYWSVTPLDAKDNEGEPSEVRSFTWEWPSATTPTVEDIAPETERYVPKFTWDPIPGAAKYEVEVNSAANFALASKVCCSTTSDVPIGASFIPKETFPNNTYYWRVRALNAEGEAGQWNEGPSFTKVFDNYPLLDEDPIKNLRMRDTGDPGTDLDGGTPGYQTDLPIVTWDPVPGASAYQVFVVPFESIVPLDPPTCNVGASSSKRWFVRTSSTSWTPLGSGSLASKPFPSGPSVSKDTPGLTPGQAYCVQVRARSGRVSLSADVWGDFTSIDDGTGASFTFTDFPTGGACSPSCNASYLGHDDYLLPIRGETITANPLFMWNPIAGKNSYWVIVAKDQSFTNIVDYAFTRLPVYAVRTGSSPRTYPDETTSYYWVVLPATGTNGSGAPGVPSQGAYADFEKQADPPVLLGPDNDSVFSGPPTFSWEAAEGAKRYRFQVATEDTFAPTTLLDNISTAATEYTAQSTYQASKTLYWRVQAEDENDNPLTWSETRTFEIDLDQPTLDPATPTLGDASLPVLRWFPVPGAVSYTLRLHSPNDNTPDTFSGFPSTAASFEKITGTGLFTWEIRADFPGKNGGTTPGPWSDDADYTHTIKEPTNPVSSAGANRLVLSWDAKTGTKQYKVQISKREDFNPSFETKATDNPDWAPSLTSSTYTSGGTFYWRVAAIDGDGNVGAYATNPETFTLPAIGGGGGGGGGVKQFKVTFSGRLVKNRARDITVKVRDSLTLNAVQGASVRAYGAGVSLTQKTTNSSGVAKFRLKPTQLAKVTFRVAKSGYVTVYLNRRVRRP